MARIRVLLHNLIYFVKTPMVFRFLVGLFFCVYIVCGFYTQLRLIELKPLPSYLHEDFNFYERAVVDALNGKDPYSIRSIGTGFLYPPPAMLIVEIFSHIQPYFLKISVFTTVNILLMVWIVNGIAKYYAFSNGRVWYWYVGCLAFAPFLELIQIGQINVITMFGIFLLFVWEGKYAIPAGFGLGLAVVTKVSPLLFLGYLLIRKNFKVVIATMTVLILFICLSILRYGITPVLEYPDVFQWLTLQFPLGNNSQSLVSKLFFIASKTQNLVSVFPQALQSPILAITNIYLENYKVAHSILMLYLLLVIFISALLNLLGKQPKEPLFIVTALAMMLSPNIMWYHHYVFILLPLLIWMGWSGLNKRIVSWCFFGLFVIQFDRYFAPYGFFNHIFGHISLLLILLWQIRHFQWQRLPARSAPAKDDRAHDQAQRGENP